MDKIPDKVKEQIIKVIEIFFPDAKIYLFGSRAKGTHHERSDIDIAIDAGRLLTMSERGQLNNMIDALNIVQEVNIVDFNNIPEALKNNILKEGIVWKIKV